jgi:methionyl-tRNA synthetase
MSESSDAKPIITYDDFIKLDLRVGTVTEAGDHPNADRLIVLQVDLGSEQRQIVAGLKAWIEPETMVGKQVVVVANLAPRKMRGLESQGMLLAGSDMSGEGDKPVNVVPLTPSSELPPGSPVS